MAQIYGGSHIAVINARSPKIDSRYEESLDNADLVLTSTGTRKSFLYLWHEEELGGSWEIDERAVGDISFVLIDAQGKAVPVDEHNRDFFEAVHEHLRPRPSHGRLVHLARQGKVIVVSAQLPPQFMHDHQGADYGPRARARVAHAVCLEGLASDCILGSTVAEYLVEGNFADIGRKAARASRRHEGTANRQ